ncbi:hypothetical protein [Rhodococcus marinonascens]|uniref:hypothetical protein n=1 Tax=Rhodococcus marinonascens TaxID=38311 RepID=UPI000933282E|nr:hypothetical protein [Rhodococcus marinonascens]
MLFGALEAGSAHDDTGLIEWGINWTVYGHKDRTRWLNHRDPMDWVADPETTAELTDPELAFPVTPTGPIQFGIPDESGLYAAAVHFIPFPRWAGDTPEHPAVRVSALKGIVY